MENAADIAVRMAKESSKKVHSGPIHSGVAGRTDHLPVHVSSGSYVIPADIVSAIGEGNSVAGFKILKDIFENLEAPYVGNSAPYAARGLPYNASTPKRAAGGSNSQSEGDVPVVVAGGEYVVTPEQVKSIGKGSLDDGHKVLDHFVKKLRAKTIKTLSNLPGPKK